MLALFTGLIFCCYVAYVIKRLHEQESNELWFETMDHPLTISEQDWHAIFRFAYDSIKNKKLAPIELSIQDEHPRMVFISFSDGKQKAQTRYAAEVGLLNTLNSVIEIIIKDHPHAVQWMSIEIVSEVETDLNVTLSQPINLDMGVEGVGLSHDVIYSPQMVSQFHLLDEEGEFNFNAIDVEIINDLIDKEQFDLYRFKVKSAFCDGKKVYQTYRGHRIYDELTIEKLDESLNLAIKYLNNALHEKGGINYLYYSLTDELSTSYNLVRHAGTVYSMVELYEYSNNQELLATIKAALQHIISHIKPMPGFERVMVLEKNNLVKLGGVAMSILAITDYARVTKDTQYDTLLSQLANYLLQVQRPNGSFSHHRVSYPEGTEDDFVSKYYPSESIYALLKLNQYKPNQQYLDAALKGIGYILKVRDVESTVNNQQTDHWLLYAYSYLPEDLMGPHYLEHIKKIGLAIKRLQIRDDEISDYNGGFARPPESGVTACHCEGIAKVIEILRRHQDPDAESFLDILHDGVRFILQTQMRSETAMRMANPQQAHGGFRAKMTTYNIRIDFVQHSTAAILAYVKELKTIGSKVAEQS